MSFNRKLILGLLVVICLFLLGFVVRLEVMANGVRDKLGLGEELRIVFVSDLKENDSIQDLKNSPGGALVILTKTLDQDVVKGQLINSSGEIFNYETARDNVSVAVVKSDGENLAIIDTPNVNAQAFEHPERCFEYAKLSIQITPQLADAIF